VTALFDDESLLAAVRARLLVLDVDGVLLDPKPSFYRAALETASWAIASVIESVERGKAAPVLDERHVGVFKAIGGWNDDFDLACALAWAGLVESVGAGTALDVANRCAGGLERASVVLSGIVGAARFESWVNRLPVKRIRERTAARYAGSMHMQAMYGFDPADFPGVPDGGLAHLEPMLCDASWLARPAWELALFTGRNPGEAQLAIDRFGLRIEASRRMVDDGSRPRKPAPDGLLTLSTEDVGMVFVGDSIDDQRAAVAYRSARPDGPRLTFVRVLDGATDHERLDARRTGADLVVSSLTEFLTLARDARQT